MKLKVRAELVYEFQSATQVLASIEAARSPDQTVISESLDVGDAKTLVRDEDELNGQRQFRACLTGQQTLVYEAVIDNGARPLLPTDAKEHAWTDLPLECLPYLLPSRFCPSDKFMRFAQREFSGLQGGAKVHGVLDWIHEHVDYVSGVSTAETTAERTFVDRAGVCRDFMHLGVTLCRGLNIPARAMSAYAWQLNPPDFHAVFEVYLDGKWWLVDPTRLAPIEGLVRIASGRDAADIAFMTTSTSCICHKVAVSATEANNDVD